MPADLGSSQARWSASKADRPRNPPARKINRPAHRFCRQANELISWQGQQTSSWTHRQNRLAAHPAARPFGGAGPPSNASKPASQYDSKSRRTNELAYLQSQQGSRPPADLGSSQARWSASKADRPRNPPARKINRPAHRFCRQANELISWQGQQTSSWTHRQNRLAAHPAARPFGGAGPPSNASKPASQYDSKSRRTNELAYLQSQQGSRPPADLGSSQARWSASKADRPRNPPARKINRPAHRFCRQANELISWQGQQTSSWTHRQNRLAAHPAARPFGGAGPPSNASKPASQYDSKSRRTNELAYLQSQQGSRPPADLGSSQARWSASKADRPRNPPARKINRPAHRFCRQANELISWQGQQTSSWTHRQNRLAAHPAARPFGGAGPPSNASKPASQYDSKSRRTNELAYLQSQQGSRPPADLGSSQARWSASKADRPRNPPARKINRPAHRFCRQANELISWQGQQTSSWTHRQNRLAAHPAARPS